MSTLYHLSGYIKKHGNRKSELYLFSLMMLFWSLFDGIVSYITPLVIMEGGLSKTMMGIVIGTSSVAGAFFDFIMCKIFKNTFYRRVFFVMFAVCFLHPFLILHAKTFAIYLIAMALWGVYYDLRSFGTFDYIGRYTKPDEHSSSFGVVQAFMAIGLLIAPIIAGLAIGEEVGFQPFAMMWIFLSISFLFFLALCFMRGSDKNMFVNKKRKLIPINLLVEFHLWEKIGKVIFPVLFLTFLLNTVDAFFWTIGPILAESFEGVRQYAGFFMTAYMLPSLLVGWFVGYFTKRYGKKKTAITSFLLGSIALTSMFIFRDPMTLVIIIFLSSMLMSLAWPANNGVYADYISEAEDKEKEIEGISDFFANLGYIVGPMAAGFLADSFGNINTFSLLGIIGVFFALVLIKTTPKKIKINNRIKN